MNVVILGASGKIGNFIYQEISQGNLLPQTKYLILQFNRNKIKKIPSNIQTKIIKMNILSKKSIKGFVKQLPETIDILINLLSTFEETPYQTSNEKIEKTIISNFLNQIILLKEMSPKIENSIIFQFLDVCVNDPYIKKYFWYSVSKSALLSFFKHLEKYKKNNNLPYKIVYILPKKLKNEDYTKIKNLISSCLENKDNFVKNYTI
ncbi:MAG: hypothetical protein ACK4F9_02685 [Brevinematia bacterium]